MPLPVLRHASTAVQSLVATIRAVTLSNIWWINRTCLAPTAKKALLMVTKFTATQLCQELVVLPHDGDPEFLFLDARGRESDGV
jgi:hypothetical protein